MIALITTLFIITLLPKYYIPISKKETFEIFKRLFYEKGDQEKRYERDVETSEN